MSKHSKPKKTFKDLLKIAKAHKTLTIMAGICFLLCLALIVPLVLVATNGFYITKTYAKEVVNQTVSVPNSVPEDPMEETEDTFVSEEDSAEIVESNKPQEEISEELDNITIYDSINTVISENWQSLSYGIDVSSHNGKIDWKKVDASGVDFVMIRCGYRGYVTGKIVKDVCFEDNIKGAHENGIEIGVYFYSTAINEAEARQEADWVCNLLDQKAEEGIKILYPVAYDFEEFFNKQKSRAEKVSRTQLTKNTIAFLNHVTLCGYHPMLYASKSSVTDYWDFKAIKDYDFWLAHYVKSTNYQGEYAMWQYTCLGKVDGIKGNVDLNVSYYRYVYPSEPIECVGDTATVYNSYNEKSSIGGTIVKDVIYERIRTLITGWSEIRYNGIIGYVKTSDIKKAEFTNCDMELTLTAATKYYSIAVPNDDYKLGTFEKGDVIKVCATYKDKWYEAVIDNKKVYFKH